eukprot:1364516-Amorphochlora_amoeboformis.AAC.2
MILWCKLVVNSGMSRGCWLTENSAPQTATTFSRRSTMAYTLDTYAYVQHPQGGRPWHTH